MKHFLLPLWKRREGTIPPPHQLCPHLPQASSLAVAEERLEHLVHLQWS